MNSDQINLPQTKGEIEQRIQIDCIEIKQPIGVFYTASIPYDELIAISTVDTRRIADEEKAGKDGIYTLLGIQRKLDKKREKEISQYVNTWDACFPTSIILSVPERCAEYNEKSKKLTLHAYKDPNDRKNDVGYNEIASVLDGQHRIAGLKGYKGVDSFEVNVSIFLELDSATEAYIFSVVNQAQTKVNKSLVYDLYSLATTRSPQRVCHQIAVMLNDENRSPFKNKIKRLGSALPNTARVSITQAAFVEALLKLMSYPQALAMEDRDIYMRGKKPKLSDEKQKKSLIFREMMIQEKDAEIAAVLWNYFSAVKERWPKAWPSEDTGIMLSKTNGFMALMRFLKDIYETKNKYGSVISQKEFKAVLDSINLKDSDFTTDNFPPGTSGEAALYKELKSRAKM